MNLNQIKEELAFLKDFDVVIFGSYATGDFREGSDIDVALVTRIRKYDANMDILKSLPGRVPPLYDIRVFELLSLKIKASVMDDYIVLYGDRPDISEYFYHYRKLWDDCRRRVETGRFKSYREQVAVIRRFKRIESRLPRIPSR